MSIWLKNLIGILLILHGLVYGIMLIPFPDMQGSGIGKFWSGFAGSKILSSFSVSDYWLKLTAIIISLIALVGFIVAGSKYYSGCWISYQIFLYHYSYFCKHICSFFNFLLAHL